MNNADMPITPTIVDTQDSTSENSGGRYVTSNGLTKREKFCLTMGVAETGDEELDAIIRKGNEKELAGLAMQGFCSKCSAPDTLSTVNKVAAVSIEMAQALLQQLEGGEDV